MPRFLLLMRHAKSSWRDPTLPDISRPLNKRGRRSADAMGNWLRERDAQPDEVLTSPSTRTLETLTRLKVDASVHTVPALYHATAETMLDLLRRASGETVLLLGHNPGMADFAGRIVTAPPGHARFFDYPTCATLLAEFAIDEWGRATWGQAHVLAFAVPREISTT